MLHYMGGFPKYDWFLLGLIIGLQVGLWFYFRARKQFDIAEKIYRAGLNSVMEMAAIGTRLDTRECARLQAENFELNQKLNLYRQLHGQDQADEKPAG